MKNGHKTFRAFPMGKKKDRVGMICWSRNRPPMFEKTTVWIIQIIGYEEKIWSAAIAITDYQGRWVAAQYLKRCREELRKAIEEQRISIYGI